MDEPLMEGKLTWIGLRPARRAGMQVVEAVQVVTETGLIGDRYDKAGGKRQVTLISAEDLEEVADILDRDSIDPGLTRRNLVVSGLVMHDLLGRRLRIGDHVVLEVTGKCHPCQRMEENLGKDGRKAMANKGGLLARVEKGGQIRVGDPVVAS